MKPRKLFRNLSIQRKLLLITLTICAVVLLLSVSAMFFFQILNFRANFKRDAATLANIIANNSTAALAFDDRKAAGEIISSLKAKTTVQCACLANSRGEVIAHFGTYDDEKELEQYPEANVFRFHDGALLYTESVELEGKSIGKLYMRSDYRSVLYQLVRFYSIIIITVLAASALLALWLSERLGRVITMPILNLAETARLVGEKRDYSARSQVEGRRDELGLLGTAFNHMLERIQTQDAAINLSQQKLESLINSIDGIVWEWNPKTSEFTFVSQQSRSVLGYTPEDWLGNSKFWDALVHPEDYEKASGHCAEAIARGLPYHYEYRMMSSDNRVVWIRESGIIISENGTPLILRGIFQDITEQKLAADQLEKLNRRLVDTSRQAGMAEVATGVLHNVGNVLNSVNVSTTLLNDEMERSKLRNLQQAAGLIREHMADLASYISTDQRGKLLPEFIVKVADAVNIEHNRWRDELKGLKKNIEHMKEIVAMQQSYARVSGVIEQLEPKELVEDALQINSAGLDRHGVEIGRDYQSVPRVSVDKHKVMQILINLIRNAKYALDQNLPRQKQIKVQIAVGSPGRVRIVIQDNGVGIPKENLTRIFAHGFTTKRDGHGFGLHSGALAAKELGGSLVASSEGPGTGATFTLELPISAPRPHLNN